MTAPEKAVTHTDIIAGLSGTERAQLLARSDQAGIAQFARHAGALCVTGSWILAGWAGWQLALVAHGILLVFLFTPLHETVHDTAFETRWINRAVGTFCGFLLVLPPRWFRAFHLAHHRHTNDPASDPELAGTPVSTVMGYAWRMTGLPVWWEHVCGLVRLAVGRDLEAFVSGRAKGPIAFEARCFLAAYGVLLGGSITLGSPVLVWTWIVPALLGQPFLRAYLMAEHTLCPHTPNMLVNTRTTFTHRVIRMLAWNMPFHAEHHSYPNVPFHKLPTFHAHLRAHLGTTAEGYSGFHREMLETVRGPARR